MIQLKWLGRRFSKSTREIAVLLFSLRCFEMEISIYFFSSFLLHHCDRRDSTLKSKSSISIMDIRITEIVSCRSRRASFQYFWNV